MLKKYQKKLITSSIIFILGLFGNFFVFNSQYVNILDIYKINILFSTFFTVFINAFLILNFIKNTKNMNMFFLFLAIIVMFIIPSISEGQIELNYLGIIYLISSSFYCVYLEKEESVSFSTKEIVEIGIFVAMAIVLNVSVFKIRLGENGGSISFAMIPLILICLRHSFSKSFIALGIIYGLLNCMFDGYGFISFPFDYLLAYGCLAIISLFRNKILSNDNKSIGFLCLSLFIATGLRLFFHTLSGSIFYGLSFIDSLIYNAAYVLPSYGITLVVILILFKTIKKFSTH